MKFIEENMERLLAFQKISQYVGLRAEYIQGGGGNTSVKLDERLMAIKASGYSLKDISINKSYAVLNYKAISDFYTLNNPTDFLDIEMEGAKEAKQSICQIEDYPALRPSVEAGFHSILGTYVIHSHSVFANLACCSTKGIKIAEEAFKGTGIIWGYIDYIDPGAKLTFAITDELKRVRLQKGIGPSVLLLQNHGLIVHSDTADDCIEKHELANKCLANAFGILVNEYPKVSIKSEGEGFISDTPYLIEQLSSGRYPQEDLLSKPLYPDQMVFLIGTLGEKAIIDYSTGKITYAMLQDAAQTLEETLTAITYISEHIRAKGYKIQTMGEAAKSFIANWESEKYRKSITEKGK